MCPAVCRGHTGWAMRRTSGVAAGGAGSGLSGCAQHSRPNSDLAVVSIRGVRPQPDHHGRSGTAESPGMTGRVDITKGTLVFFGNQYTVDEGNVSFYNTSKIEPIVGIAFETKAQGVQVTMRVSGPMEDLKLSYTSDPPLRFEEIVALLAAGKTPSDPTIAAHQPAPPDQSLSQLGGTALVQQTIANPLANRLQRVFGVSQLKIDPTFTTGSTLPQARLTLQQQVTPEITFSYSQDLTQSNSQLVRVEWAFTPRFSAVATREENGIVSLDFFYKKRFR